MWVVYLISRVGTHIYYLVRQPLFWSLTYIISHLQTFRIRSNDLKNFAKQYFSHNMTLCDLYTWYQEGKTHLVPCAPASILELNAFLNNFEIITVSSIHLKNFLNPLFYHSRTVCELYTWYQEGEHTFGTLCASLYSGA